MLKLSSGSGPAALKDIGLVRAIARVEHPALGAIYRIGRFRGSPYLVAEFLRGQSLADLSDPLEIGRLLEVGRALAQALAALHRAGLFYGALSLKNVILAEDGEIRLVSPVLSDSAVWRSPGGSIEAHQREDRRALAHLIRELGRGRSLGAWLDRWIAETCGASPKPRDDNAPATIEEVLLALDAEERARPDPSPGEDDRGSEKEDAAHAEPTPRPYRGLLSFNAEHHALFFGRRNAIERVLATLRVAPWVVIAGGSGNGKSSLARAGVGALVQGGAIGERAGWEVVAMVPGRHPLAALERAIGFGAEDKDVRSALFARIEARKHAAQGFLLVVDQLEEIFTLADPVERVAFLEELSVFAALTPGLRLVATLRSDFFAPMVALPGIGGALARATMILDPMTREELVECIVAPARRFGFELSPAIVETLTQEALRSTSGLPLLSFVMSELWERRDLQSGTIPESALAELGGLLGALGRHADRVIEALPPEERREARRILMALVTPSRTRARVLGKELALGGNRAAVEALRALVSGRLVVAGGSDLAGSEGSIHTLAHEALIDGWPRLRAWIEEESELHAAKKRAERAAEEWARLGRGSEGLWNQRQLKEAPAAGGPLVLEFLEKSKKAVREKRNKRLLVLGGTPLLVLFASAAVWLALDAQETRARIERVEMGRRLIEEARAREAERKSTEALAFEAFDRGDAVEGEAGWSRAREQGRKADQLRQAALQDLDDVLSRDPGNDLAKKTAARVVYERLLAAEREHDELLVHALRSRLRYYDDGQRIAALTAPGELVIDSHPAGARLRIVRFTLGPSGRLTEAPLEPPIEGQLVPFRGSLAPGSYLAVARLSGRVEARLPFVIERGAARKLTAHLVPGEALQKGFVYVPSGPFHYGSGDPEETRKLLDAEPEHELELGAFLIARFETTRKELLEFRRALVESGEPPLSCGSGCDERNEDLPAGGVSWDQATAYAAWLARTGRVPRARLCSEREWEKAARGADGRRYPHGMTLGADEACSLSSSPAEPQRAGPCPLGSHPATASVFGVEDLAGNLWEWTRDPPSRDRPTMGVLRGGSWSTETDNPWLFSSNRGIRPKSASSEVFGIRICADLP